MPKSEGELKTSVQETMGAVFDKLEDDDETLESEQQTEADSGTELAAADAGSDTGGEGSEEESEVSGAEAETDAEESSEEESEEESSEEVDDEIRHPPSSLTAKAKSKWKDLDPDIKREFHKRAADDKKAYEANKDKVLYADKFRELINPYTPMLRSMGADEFSAVRDSLDFLNMLRTGTPEQKAQVFQNMAQAYGVPLPQAGEEKQPPAPQPQDPRYSHLEQRLTQFEQQQQNREAENVNLALQEFENELDENGDKKYPYYANVWEDMRDSIPSVRRANPGFSPKEILVAAYDKAVWANPSTRSLLQAGNLQAEKRDASQQARKNATSAKKKAKGNLQPREVGKSGDESKGGSPRDTMEAIFDKINAR